MASTEGSGASAASQQEVTAFVQTLLGQMQASLWPERDRCMSQGDLGLIDCSKVLLSCVLIFCAPQGRFGKLSENIIAKIDDMGTK